MNTSTCSKCGTRLTTDEKAIYMKLISRTARSFLCLDCLSIRLDCSRRDLEDKIKYYRDSGNCVLFR